MSGSIDREPTSTISVAGIKIKVSRKLSIGVAKSCDTCEWFERNNLARTGICARKRERISDPNDISQVAAMYTPVWAVCDEWQKVHSIEQRLRIVEGHIMRITAAEMLGL